MLNGPCLYREAVAQPSPGSRVFERTLGGEPDKPHYPEGVTHAGIIGVFNPFGVMGYIIDLSQGALADSRPWAVVSNAFGVKQFESVSM